MTCDEFKALDSWNKIRAMSGIIQLSGDHERDSRMLQARMYFFCLVARYELGDVDQATYDRMIESMFGVKKEEPTETK
jgi:hypothetical protein